MTSSHDRIHGGTIHVERHEASTPRTNSVSRKLRTAVWVLFLLCLGLGVWLRHAWATSQEGQSVVTLTDGTRTKTLKLTLDQATGNVWVSEVGSDGRLLIRLDEESACFGAANSDGLAVVLGFSDGQPTLSLGGSPRYGLVLHASEKGASVGLYDPDDRPRAVVAVTENEPGFALYDENGNARAVLSLKEDGTPQLEFRDADGEVVWEGGAVSPKQD
jgi:hypothetical protein